MHSFVVLLLAQPLNRVCLYLICDLSSVYMRFRVFFSLYTQKNSKVGYFKSGTYSMRRAMFLTCLLIRVMVNVRRDRRERNKWMNLFCDESVPLMREQKKKKWYRVWYLRIHYYNNSGVKNNGVSITRKKKPILHIRVISDDGLYILAWSPWSRAVANINVVVQYHTKLNGMALHSDLSPRQIERY